ncbi:MAG: UvrD-helicase domain-containing protein, partial [Phycisphaeraceae bacterium]
MSGKTSHIEAPAADDPLLDDLTEPQRRAVTHVDGPLLVLAGAGSGKTRVITRRVARLILRVGIAPWNVLAITFTNKAAGEMRDRLGSLLSERQARAVAACTFHSLCARRIREYADRLDLPTGYSIYDTADQDRALKQVLEALEISPDNFPPAKVLSVISNAKNELIDAEAFAAAATGFYDRTVARIYTKYQNTLIANHALDFDDLLLVTVRLFKQHPDVLAELRDRYQYILIDEYQDTNHAQFVIADALAAEHKNICATGDPDQSIYAWRGANIRNILEFESHYPDATVVRLEQNYRSTKHILAVADRLIQHNTQRKHKALWTDNEDGEPVTLVVCLAEHEEARWVVDQFRDLRDQRRMPWRDMAVFYRVNSLSRVIEDELRNSGIPYQIARGTAFYERKEIKDAVAYLRVIANPADSVNLLRIINTPARGISPATVKAMRSHVVSTGMGLDQVLQAPADVKGLNARAVAAVQQFAKLLQTWRGQTDSIETSLRTFVEQVLAESGLQKYYSNDKTDPDQERLMNLGELVSSAQQFEDEIAYDDVDNRAEQPLARRLEAYLERISLVSDVDTL